MKVENLEIGKEYRWRELCDALEIKISDGGSRKKDIKELKSLCRFKKEGVTFIIEEIYDKQKRIIDKRKLSSKEGRKNKNIKYDYLDLFKTKYYVYCHKKNNKVIYVGKGTKYRCVSSEGRKYDIENNNIKVEIIERFEDETEALSYEKEMIQYYQSIGQCEYNDIYYHVGKYKIDDKLKEEKFNKKTIRDYNKMFKYEI